MGFFLAIHIVLMVSLAHEARMNSCSIPLKLIPAVGAHLNRLVHDALSERSRRDVVQCDDRYVPV